MLESRFERRGGIGEFLVGFGYGVEGNAHAVVYEISAHHHCVVALFLSLNFVPVLEPVEPFGGVVVGEIEIQISRIQFFVYLLVNELCYLFV